MKLSEVERVVDEILLKQARGERLTNREYRIIAYIVTACKCRCGRDL